MDTTQEANKIAPYKMERARDDDGNLIFESLQIEREAMENSEWGAIVDLF